jgi:hypothetical protein
MIFHQVLTISLLLGISSAMKLEARDEVDETPFKLYAWGDGITALNIFYAEGEWALSTRRLCATPITQQYVQLTNPITLGDTVITDYETASATDNLVPVICKLIDVLFSGSSCPK